MKPRCGCGRRAGSIGPGPPHQEADERRPGETVFWHMLQHVVNHASYHRGQITTMLRQLGACPPPQDLIRYYRERPIPNP